MIDPQQLPTLGSIPQEPPPPVRCQWCERIASVSVVVEKGKGVKKTDRPGARHFGETTAPACHRCALRLHERYGVEIRHEKPKLAVSTFKDAP